MDNPKIISPSFSENETIEDENSLKQVLANVQQQSKLMKKSQQLTSPAFLKKQSHIQAGSGTNQDCLQVTSNIRSELQTKEMCNSHLQSEANSNKVKEDNLDSHDPVEISSEEKQQLHKEGISNESQPLLEAGPRQPLQSFYQSDELSSEQQNSQTKSHKKFGVNPYTLSEKMIKRGASNSNRGQQKFLYINSKKQKYNNNFMFLSDIDALKQQIRKYQISIEKLKEENFKLRSEKMKLSSTNQSMQLIELRLELQDQKKRVKQLETEKELHITVANKDQKTQNGFTNSNVQKLTPNNNHPQGFMTSSRLEALSKIQQKDEEKKINAPTFRSNQQMDQNKGEPAVNSTLNSPRAGPAAVTEKSKQVINAPIPTNKIIQIIKSPYFLRKV